GARRIVATLPVAGGDSVTVTIGAGGIGSAGPDTSGSNGVLTSVVDTTSGTGIYGPGASGGDTTYNAPNGDTGLGGASTTMTNALGFGTGQGLWEFFSGFGGGAWITVIANSPYKNAVSPYFLGGIGQSGADYVGVGTGVALGGIGGNGGGSHFGETDGYGGGGGGAGGGPNGAGANGGAGGHGATVNGLNGANGSSAAANTGAGGGGGGSGGNGGSTGGAPGTGGNGGSGWARVSW